MELSRNPFAGVQFVGYIKQEMKFLRNGDLNITIQVPFDYKWMALPLTDAYGIPLSVDIQVWEPYEETGEEQ